MSWTIEKSERGLVLRESEASRLFAAALQFAGAAALATVVVAAFLLIEVAGRAAAGLGEMPVHPIALVVIASVVGTAGAMHRYLRQRTWLVDAGERIIALQVGSKHLAATELPVSLDELERIVVERRPRGRRSTIVAEFDDARDVMLSTWFDHESLDAVERALREELRDQGVPVVVSETNPAAPPL